MKDNGEYLMSRNWASARSLIESSLISEYITLALGLLFTYTQYGEFVGSL